MNDLLSNDCPPYNLLLYFFDMKHELENKLQGANKIDKDIVDAFIQLMSENQYAQFFRSVKDIAHTNVVML